VRSGPDDRDREVAPPGVRGSIATARPRVAFVTLGCKVNHTESDAAAAELLARGVEIVRDPSTADAVVINTCTVTAEADRKARKAVRHTLGLPAEPAVVVTGCLAALDADGLRSLGDRVAVQADKAAVAATVAALVGASGETRSGASAEVHAAPPGAGSTTRVMIKVEDGCDNACTYCIVPKARGGSRAIPSGRLLAEVRALAAAGTREVVLTGINIGRYRDLPATADLPALLELLAGTGMPRIRLSSIEPPDVTAAFLEVVRRHPQVMPHLHIPLQSGSDRTLRAMGRAYTTDDFARMLAAARGALPHLAVTTDVIVGFPAEKDDDHAASLAFVEACGFSKLHVFRYSARPGTPAADMDGQVDPRVKAARAAGMRALGTRLAATRAAWRIGGYADVLVERVADPVAGTAEGTSEDYLHVVIEGSHARPGDLVRVRITGLAPLARSSSPASVTAVEDRAPVVEST
jgi:threonylcarbamoyladenosine tRNA methylthiotransferase MtaB